MMLFFCDTLLIMQLTVLTLAFAVGGSLAQVSDSQVPVGHISAEHTNNLSLLQFPNVTYPDGVSPNPNAILGAQTNQTSPASYPSPWGSGAGEWAEAYKKAIKIVEQLTLEEKVNLTTGEILFSVQQSINEADKMIRIWLAARTMCWSDWWCASPWYSRSMSSRFSCRCKIH
jgi:hypothetical protein